MPALPTGSIILWFGSIANIPSGFVLCNGAGGTPDLRDRFLVGAGDTYSVDDTGGNVNHNHPFTGDDHTHDLPGGADVEAGAGYNDTSTSDPSTGTTDNANGLPPYHSLAYIMKT